MYSYERSQSGRHVLLRDNIEVARGTEQEVWQYIHRNHCYSVDHALKHEGYAIVTEEGHDEFQRWMEDGPKDPQAKAAIEFVKSGNYDGN